MGCMGWYVIAVQLLFTQSPLALYCLRELLFTRPVITYDVLVANVMYSVYVLCTSPVSCYLLATSTTTPYVLTSPGALRVYNFLKWRMF